MAGFAESHTLTAASENQGFGTGGARGRGRQSTLGPQVWSFKGKSPGGTFSGNLLRENLKSFCGDSLDRGKQEETKAPKRRMCYWETELGVERCVGQVAR